MPFIQVNVTQKLDTIQKDAIVRGLGEKISVIPGKSEKALMIDVSDSHALYMAGSRLEQGAYLDVKIYGETEVVNQKAFAEAAFGVMHDVLELKPQDMYLTFSQFPNWGCQGTMK